MKMTPEQLDAHNQRRRARLERIATRWLFVEWIDGLGWHPCDVHAWAWARQCAAIRVSLADSSGESAAEGRVAMRMRRDALRTSATLFALYRSLIEFAQKGAAA